LNEKKLIREFSALSSSIISDIMDDLDIAHNIINIKTIVLEKTICGRAVTVTAEPTNEKLSTSHIIEAIDKGKENDILFINAPNVKRGCVVGEMLSTAAKRNNMSGIIVNGGVRDIESIKKLSFPVYSRYVSNEGPMGRITTTGYQNPIKIGDVNMKPNDIIFADDDGIVVIPQEKTELILRKSKGYMETEELVKKKIVDGKPLADAAKLIGEYRKYS
tara:strand:+ start:220 stop:873 length:654 start_codon:yes stop_codon:yes gene_type:complete